MHLGMPESHKPFLGHCDLDLWFSFKNYCVQSISPILFDVGIPNLGCWFLLGWRSGAYHFESLWPWHWLLASFLGFSCYITAKFTQMCLMLDQFLWGHSSRVYDISCLSFLAVLNLDIFFSKMLRGCLVCVICNTKWFHSLIFKLCIMIIHTLHHLFCAHLINIFLFFRSVELWYFIHPKCSGGVWFV